MGKKSFFGFIVFCLIISNSFSLSFDEKELFQGIQKNNINKVKKLLTKKVNINCFNEQGNTPLIFAANINKTDIVKVLLENKADVNMPNKNEATPIMFANSVEILNLLIDAGANINKLDNNERSLFHFVSQSKNKIEIVKYLIEKNIFDVNVQDKIGFTPLHIACSFDLYDTAVLLVDAGANVNKKDKKGFTPIFRSLLYGDVKTFKYLVEKGADLKVIGNDGNNTLHELATVPLGYYKKEIAQILIQSGVDINLKNNNGDTPLHVIIKNREVSMYIKMSGEIPDYAISKISDYKELGADVKITDKDGKTIDDLIKK